MRNSRLLNFSVSPRQLVSVVTAVLVLLLAAGSFAISWDALRDMALRYGFEGWRANIWPLLVDASLVIFSLAVVNAHLNVESVWRQWGLVFIYTAGTVFFNVLHAPDNTMARVMAAVAPVSLFFSFELLMGQMRGAIARREIVSSVHEYEIERDTLQRDITKLAKQKERLTLQIAENTQFDGISMEKVRQGKEQAQQNRIEQLFQLKTTQPDATQQSLADQMNLSVSTIRRYEKKLNGRVADAQQN